MGLLDNANMPFLMGGLGLLSASGPSLTPNNPYGGLSQGLMQGLMFDQKKAYQAQQQQYRQQQLQIQQQAAQRAQQQHQAAMAAHQKQQQEQQQYQQAFAPPVQPGAAAGTPAGGAQAASGMQAPQISTMKMLFPKATEAELATAQMMPPKEGMKYLSDNQRARNAPPTANTNLAKAKIDLQNGLITQQQYDAIVKAESTGGGGNPPAPVLNFARRQELVAEYGEGSPEVLRFDNYVRASQYGNTGSAIIQHNPANPTAPTVVAPITLKPGEEPAVRGAQAAATAAGKIEGETAAQAAVDYSQAAASADEMVTLLEKVKSHPGLQGVVGVPNLQGALPIPGTNEADFKVLLDQIKGKQFLAAYQDLKGGGQITEVEGKKATDAMARMNTAQTEKEFLKAVDDFQAVIERGRSRAAVRAGKARETVRDKVLKFDSQGNQIDG